MISKREGGKERAENAEHRILGTIKLNETIMLDT
jgi:hypothetical protein